VPTPRKEEVANILAGIVGEENVSADEATTFCYSCDSSTVGWFALFSKSFNFRPDVVVRPSSTQEVSQIMRYATEHKIPVTPRGAGTSVSGNPLPTRGGILLDMTRMNHIKEIKQDDLLAVVEAGVMYYKLNEELKKIGFFFPPEPGSAEICTIGGMIANNAAGIRACKYGSTKDWILGLEVVLPNGEIIKTGGRTLKASSGYDLTRLFTSSEGTLGVITEATIKIHPLPECVILIVPSFNNVEDATEAMGVTFKQAIIPATMELISGDYIKAMNQILKEDEKLPVAEVVLLIDVDGNKTAVAEEVDRIIDICKMCKAVEVKLVRDLAIRKKIWHARHYAAFVISRVLPPPEKIKLWGTHFVDVGVPLSKVPAIIGYLKELSAKYGVTLIPFGHIADGNVHVSWWADPRDKEELKKARDIGLDLLRKAKDLGGTISAEHGIGILRAPYMNLEHPTTLNLMRQLKKLIDPNGIMNPGKLALEDIPEDLFLRLLRELYPEERNDHA